VLVGVLLPRHSTDVSAAQPGTLREVRARLGDHVEAGAVLATFDVRLAALERRIAEAALGSAGSSREQLRVEQLRAEEHLERVGALQREGIAPGADLSDAEFQSAIGAARVSGADAQLEEQRARVERLRALEGEAVVRAPFSGTIAARYVDPGSTLAAGEAIVRIVSDDDAVLRFALPERSAARPVVHGRVLASARTLPGLTLRAEIERVAPEIDPASRMLIVEARAEASAGSELQRLGTTFDVRLLEQSHAER
jgi:RND family efflux transporter MFP subunit